MIKFIPALLLFIVVIVVFSCKASKDTIADTPDMTAEASDDAKKTENNPDELVDFTWSIIYIQELDARILPKKATSITFKEGNQASIGLSVNSCFGSYKASETVIKIVEEGCTEKCCDDNFDKQLLALIRKNEFSYELSDGKLVLSAANSKIVLTKN